MKYEDDASQTEDPPSPPVWVDEARRPPRPAPVQKNWERHQRKSIGASNALWQWLTEYAQEHGFRSSGALVRELMEAFYTSVQGRRRKSRLRSTNKDPKITSDHFKALAKEGLPEPIDPSTVALFRQLDEPHEPT